MELKVLLWFSLLWRVVYTNATFLIIIKYNQSAECLEFVYIEYSLI